MKKAGLGILMLGTLLLFWPSMMEILQALIGVFDILLPGDSKSNTAFVHLYPLMILVVWGGIGIYLILSSFLHRGQEGG